MPRLMFDPEQYDRVPTRALRNDNVAEGVNLRFDEAGRTEQDLDEDVAEAFIETDLIRYDLVRFEEADEAGLDEIGELLEGTVDEVAAAIDDGEYDDRLDEVERRERQTEERVGVLDTIEDRRDETVGAEEA